MAQAKKKAMQKTSKLPKQTGKAAAAGAGIGAVIQSWATDPHEGSPPLQRSAPTLPGASLPTKIVDPASAPTPKVYATGTPEFRYWTAAETLRRTAAYWSAAGTNAWNPEIGGELPVRLDDGIDLNAYYARTAFPSHGIQQGLSFFHDTVHDLGTAQDVTVFSGESPDVVAHELGHAVLDAIKPALWGMALTEASAFHESFGDMSAVLTALQLPEVRQAVLEETTGRLGRNSFVSRVAEQLGFAIRQRHPAAVDIDCLRNAANSFIYADPVGLPPNGPASGLTRAPHNFSRVFTGAFLEILGGMVTTLGDPPSGDDILEASRDLGSLLVRAVVKAPVRTRFFQAVAEQLVLADSDLFAGRYGQPLTSALIRRGLLPLTSLAAPSAARARSSRKAVAAAALAAATAAGGVDESGAVTASAEPVKIALDGVWLGLSATTLYVEAPAIEDVGAAGFALGIAGELPGTDRHAAARAFVEELIVRGRVAGESARARVASIVESASRKRVTHRLVAENEGLRLERLAIDCAGCCACAIEGSEL